LLHVLNRILPGGRGEADDRRHVAEAVEEAVGCEIDVALGPTRGDPADRPRRDDGVERIVLQAMAVLGLVKVQVLRALRVHDCVLAEGNCPLANAGWQGSQGPSRPSGRSQLGYFAVRGSSARRMKSII